MITYGSREVIRHRDVMYRVVSKHYTKATAKKRDQKYDSAVLIIKDGKWWLRVNYLPESVTINVEKYYGNKIRTV